MILATSTFWGPHPNDPKINAMLIAGSLVVGLVFIVLLTFVPRKFRKGMIVAATFLGGLYYSMEYLLPDRATAQAILASHAPAQRLASLLFGWLLHSIAARTALDPDQNLLSPSVRGITNAWQVIAGFTFALGLWNLVHIHGRNILRASKNWVPSLFFFLGVVVMAVAGLLSTYGPYKTSPLSQAAFQVATSGLFFPLDATMFSLIAFFIISAAYRAFRIRSMEGTVMMVSALLVMLGQVPIGIWMTSWISPTGPFHNLRLENISYWILTQPNAAAQRGISFGLAVGALAMGLRIWLSLERGSYFEQEV